jgi:hypothetical protein
MYSAYIYKNFRVSVYKFLIIIVKQLGAISKNFDGNLPIRIFRGPRKIRDIFRKLRFVYEGEPSIISQQLMKNEQVAFIKSF